MSKAGYLGLAIKTLQDTGFSKKRINEIIKRIEKLLGTISDQELEKIYIKLTKRKKEKNINGN